MKHSVFWIFTCCAVMLATGMSVAYYNTKSFGFDEDAKIISYDEKTVTVFDFTVQRSDAQQLAKSIYDAVPHKTFCCEYNVYKDI